MTMKRFRIKIIIVSFFILIGILSAEAFQRFDKAVKIFAETQGENRVYEIVNHCILETVEKLSAEYNSICKIHYNSAGKITAIIVNPESVNRLKGETISAIIRAMKDNGKETIAVPLGTLLGSRLFSAKGPDVNIEIIPLGAVASELTQKFTSVGINQTLHSLYLDVRISVKIAAPFSSSNLSVMSKVCIAENVIFGDIPFAYHD